MRTCLLQTHSKVNEDLYQLTLPNHAAYAGRHEYDMAQINCSYDDAMTHGLDYIETELARYDWVFSIGSDIIFTKPEMPMSAFDDNIHSVFLGEEGLGSAFVNFDLVLWKNSEGTRQIIRRLRELEPEWSQHSWGLQAGVILMLQEQHPAAVEHLAVYSAGVMQSAPFPNQRGTWNPGDFALHFVGMSNADKYAGCRQFLEDGTVRWMSQVGRNDG